MIAVKCEMPNMPRLETVKVPPYASPVSGVLLSCTPSVTYLVLLRLKFAVTGLLRKRLALGRYGRKTLSAHVLDDRRNQACGSCDGDGDVRLLVPA